MATNVYDDQDERTDGDTGDDAFDGIINNSYNPEEKAQAGQSAYNDTAGDIARREGLGGGTYDHAGNSPSGHRPSIPSVTRPNHETSLGGKKDGKGSGLGGLKAAEGIGKGGAATGAAGTAKDAAEIATAAASGNTFKAILKAVGSARGKRRGVIGGLAATAVLTALIAGLFMTLPLKVLSITTNLQNVFFSSAEDAANRMDDNLIRHYLIKKVVPGMVKGKCTTTHIAKSCAAVSSEGNVVTQMYRAWRDANIEGKLADKYGIEIQKDGANHFYLKTPQVSSRIDLGDYDGNTKNFEDKAFAEMNRSEVRTALRASFKDMTYSKGMFYRFTTGKLLERKYGIVRCILACKARDTAKDKIELKKTAAKLYFNERVLAPYSEGMSLAVECGVNGFNCTKLEGSDENGEKLSSYQKDLKARLTDYRVRNDGPGRNSLETIDKDAENIRTKGFAGYVLEKVAGETAAKIGTKAIPIVGWVLLGAQIVAAASTVGPAVQHIDYVMNSTAAVQTFSMYRVAGDEIKTGDIDPDELGSINTSFDQNKNADQGGAAAEASPLYQQMFAKPDSAGSGVSLLNSIMPTAYADTDQRPLCNDGKPYPKGQLVCDEMRTDALSTAGKVLTTISDATNLFAGGTAFVAKVITTVVNTAIDLVTPDFISQLIGKMTPEKLKDIMEWAEKWVMSKVLATWVTDAPSGARLFEASAMGADVAGNDVAHLGQGAKVGSAHDITIVQARVDKDRKAEFALLPLKDRIFSTDESQSVMSQLALAMPSSGNSPVSVTASLLQGFSTMTLRGLAAMFTPMSVSADGLNSKSVPGDKNYDPGQKPNPDPFGILQYFYPDNDQAFSADPEALYDQLDCKNPDQVKNWGDKATDVDANTGQAIQNETDPCLLLKDRVSSNGGLFDAALIGAYGSSDSESTSDSGSSTGSGAAGAFGWPFNDATVKKYWQFFLGSHTVATGTAWGADSMGTIDKGAGIADDIGVPAGTHVLAMLGGTVTSTNLCGAGDGMAIKTKINGNTLGISYMHGSNQQFKVGDTVNAGDYIMDSGEIGCHVYGAHLHIGMAYNGRYICPQDAFAALKAGQTPNWASLTSKATRGCDGRYQ